MNRTVLLIIACVTAFFLALGQVVYSLLEWLIR
jgi:hypothetical protein